MYAVDNALARVADPVFYGFVHERQADVGVKVVSKKHAKESVGVVCLHEEGAHVQRYGVIEYSEMPESMTTAKDDSGKLQFRASHICINMFSVQYLEKLTRLNFQLEFHPAVKRIPHMRESSGTWEAVNPEKPNGIKLEEFIFDSFQCCNSEKVGCFLSILLLNFHSDYDGIICVPFPRSPFLLCLAGKRHSFFLCLRFIF